MAKRSNYDVEDFLLNESFIEWILNDSEKETIFWNAWINQHPGCLPAINTAKKTLIALHVKSARHLTDTEIDLIIAELQKRTQQTNKVSKIKLLSKNPVSLAIAAVTIILISVGYIFFKQYRSSFDIDYLTIYIKQQQNNTKSSMLVKLADGSSVILKPEASISYPNRFSGKNREVSLNGEAFFEVQKDATHPFLVHSGDWITRVVGTSFTIKACNKTKAFKVIVNTGKVLVYNNNPNDLTALPAKEAATKQVFITPNQEVAYNAAQKSLVKDNLPMPLLLSADPSKELFTFHETPLNKVVANIERAYNVNITYNEKQMGGCPLTASLGDEHLLEKLDLICKALDARYFINEGQISIQGTGCNSK